MTALLVLSLLLSPPGPEVLAARNLGLAQLEEGRNKEARKTFERLAALVPSEPLPFADAAIAALRDKDLAGAEALLSKAPRGGGGDAAVHAVRAALEEAKGRPDEARAAWAKAAALDPKDLESRWRYARSVETSGAAEETKAARRRFLAEIVAASPANLPARLKLLLAELEGGTPDAPASLAELERLLGDADAKTKGYLTESRLLLAKGDAKGSSLKVRVVENLLRVTSRYQQSLGELFTNVEGIPLTAFSPALEAALRPKGSTAVPVALVSASLPAEDPGITLRRADLLNAGKAEPYPIPAPYGGAAFLDFDLDGDLDVYLFGGGAPDKLLRNNLDGTWLDVTAATGSASFTSTKAIAVDLDRDGDGDLVAIDTKGALVLRDNLRQGRFAARALLPAPVLDVDAADLNGDGIPDLAAATPGGVTLLLSGAGGVRTTASVPAAGATKVLLADLDNDGFVDLLVRTAKGIAAFRNAGGAFTPWPIAPPGEHAVDRWIALDVDHDGDLDVVIASRGKISVLRNDGGNANAWLDVVVEGLPTGSGKVNRAGVGSVVEAMAGDLRATAFVGVLPAHLGLGAHGKADVVRCVFPNGVPQNVFDQRARAVMKEVQKLKGSCPFVYAKNGETGVWSFVSDALGRAPIGLLYDGVHLAGADSREWLLVSGDALAPDEEGKLVVDYTEELWEAAYLDEATLMAVDHPEGTAIVPNERMVPGILEKKLFTVAQPRAPRAAFSETNGRTQDVLDALSRRDGVYVDPGTETRYQGVRDEHALVLDLGPVSKGSRVVLFLTGWIFYTDTSINVSLSQRRDVKVVAPVLEVPDGRGGWRVAIESLGFPAGKTKTMPVDLTSLLDPDDPRVRIRTTMAIFWDEAFVTVDDPKVPLVTTTLSPAAATLFERGFSRGYRETPDGPELFDHDDVDTAPRWEDVPGLVTRLGDVTDLLAFTDDRYVVFRGGDAVRITFDATRLPPLAPGFRRDYVLVSDGWDKDFDKNTVTGQSIEPYPFHAMSSYPYPEAESFPDSLFLEEWMTRRVGPERFRESRLR